MPDWMLGLYEASPILVGALVALVVAASIVGVLWFELFRHRRRR